MQICKWNNMDSQLVLKAGSLIKKSLKRILYFEFDVGFKRRRPTTNSEELTNFLKLLDDEQVKCFLINDADYMLADNYLIAMTCIYFIRARLPPAQYDAQHFFSALYLAHQIEEDWEQFRHEIVPWFPPTNHESCASKLNQIKNSIWRRMNYNCLVSKDVCDNLMRETFTWKVWDRVREYERYVKAISNETANRKICLTRVKLSNPLETSEWEIDSNSSSSSIGSA